MTGPVEYSIKRARTATHLMFLLGGIAVSSWAPMVPLAKQRTGLNEAGLGLILLTMGGGRDISDAFCWSSHPASRQQDGHSHQRNSSFPGFTIFLQLLILLFRLASHYLFLAQHLDALTLP
jgi:hypothetical protein